MLANNGPKGLPGSLGSLSFGGPSFGGQSFGGPLFSGPSFQYFNAILTESLRTNSLGSIRIALPSRGLTNLCTAMRSVMYCVQYFNGIILFIKE